MPGVSAMSDAEAAGWHGRIVRLTAHEAISAESHCDAPGYVSRSVATDRFLATEYNLAPGALTRLVRREQNAVLDVSCRGVGWAAMGARLIGIDTNRALAPWDGVFFELAREHDFRALGQEPGWQLELFPGREIRFTYDYGARTAVTPAPAPETDAKSATRVYHAVTEAHDLRVVIEPTPCTDVMNGKPFAATVTVILDGRTFHGCGAPLP
jgi:uncharacterized membrane protein